MIYSKEITEVHNEFNTAAEKLLQEAKDLLNSIKIPDKTKLEKMKTFGFINTPEFQEAHALEIKAQKTKEIAELISYYAKKYPLYKFIQEDQVFQICGKYGLICGETIDFKGFVPKKNLLEIDKFKKPKIVDCVWKTPKNWGGGYSYVDFNKYVKLSSYEKSLCIKVSKHNLLICAPEKDFYMKGKKVEDYKIVEKHVPDPVVLYPVRGGYLIVTAWGEEASDPLVVNEKNN